MEINVFKSVSMLIIVMRQVARSKQPAPPRERGLFEVINGRFRPIQELGSGGVCRVDLAEDSQSGEYVAIKRLKGDKLASKDAHTTMAIEAVALTRIKNISVPNLVSASLGG